jgi:hypothetical protein
MSFEETLRLIVREELARLEAKLLEHPVAAVPVGEDRLLGPKEIEPLTGYSPETVKSWVRQGRLKRYGTPRGWRVSERELRQYLAGLPTSGARRVQTDADILELARERASRGR